jgi:excisionase family DNA binding protein
VNKEGYMSQSNYSLSTSSTQENLLTPAEVATLFRVDPKTVTRWAKAGKLTSIRTLGGHRRYKESEVKELLKATTPNQSGGN